MTTSTYASTHSVETVVSNLKSIGLPPEWDSATNTLVAGVYRQIATGQPVTSTTAESLIEASGLEPGVGREFLAGVSEKDDDGNIIGSVGLSQDDHAHKLSVNGVELSTWCAWDALFIPQVLGQEAHVVSNAPTSNREVQLTVGPDGAKANPEEAVVSFVLLSPEQIDTDSLESLFMTFCHQIYFFPSFHEAEAWTNDRDFAFAILSVEDAFRVGAIAFENLIRAARV